MPITRAALTQELHQLEAGGLVARHVYAQVSVRVEYSLTPFGRRITLTKSAAV
ncbi:MAG: winged helix-turn-helix transcriptional regulator [Pirellulales bacterium]|nr:winged helix-turn-helix transcriptional regulator [Pirellulales bacterium]